MYTIGEQHWVRRAQNAVKQISKGATVLDLGCGPKMILREVSCRT